MLVEEADTGQPYKEKAKPKLEVKYMNLPHDRYILSFRPNYEKTGQAAVCWEKKQWLEHHIFTNTLRALSLKVELEDEESRDATNDS